MKKVLIIDDEEPILRMYGDILADYTVSKARTGKEGIAVAKAEKPDLIYLDIIMPEMNGLDVLKALKEDDDTKNIPVVLLTNLPEEASKDKAVSLGALDYLVKVEWEPMKLIEKTKEILQ
ncbi:MAG TPA: response regulator [bacterium]|nr:response regulator [bacterium]